MAKQRLGVLVCGNAHVSMYMHLFNVQRQLHCCVFLNTTCIHTRCMFVHVRIHSLYIYIYIYMYVYIHIHTYIILLVWHIFVFLYICTCTHKCMFLTFDVMSFLCMYAPRTRKWRPCADLAIWSLLSWAVTHLHEGTRHAQVVTSRTHSHTASFSRRFLRYFWLSEDYPGKYPPSRPQLPSHDAAC